MTPPGPAGAPSDRESLTRRSFLGSLAALAAAPAVLPWTGSAAAQGGAPPIPVRSWNHMTLTVTDIGRSLEFYQGLFGMTIAARQAQTLILRIGSGPQFVALGGGGPGARPHINHFCLTVDDFGDDRLVGILGEQGRRPDGAAGPQRPAPRARPNARRRVRRRAGRDAGALSRRSGRRRGPAPGHHLLRRRGAARRALPDARAVVERGDDRAPGHQPLHRVRGGPAAVHRVLPGAVRNAGHPVAGGAAAAVGGLGAPVPRARAGAGAGPHSPRVPDPGELPSTRK